MFYTIPKTKMLTSAQNSLSPASKPMRPYMEILIFLIVFMVISAAQSTVTSIITSVLMYFDAEYTALMDSLTESVLNGDNSIDFAKIMEMSMEFAMEFMQRIPPEAYALILAASGIMIPGSMIYCRCIEKRSLFSMGFNKRGAVPEYLLGILVGAVMISVPALVSMLTGATTLVFNPQVNPLMIVIFFLAFMLQGMGEEVLLRGYFLTTLSRRYNVWVSIIISSLMFSVMHIGNANFSIIAFINIALFGIFAAVYMLKRGSIWGVGAIHTVWNFMQGNIYGFSVSGNPQMPTVFDSKLGEAGSILSGGEFGLEGGLGATIILLVALLWVLMMPAKKSELDESEIKTEDK